MVRHQKKLHRKAVDTQFLEVLKNMLSEVGATCLVEGVSVHYGGLELDVF